jgi:hypothetical protein
MSEIAADVKGFAGFCQAAVRRATAPSDGASRTVRMRGEKTALPYVPCVPRGGKTATLYVLPREKTATLYIRYREKTATVYVPYREKTATVYVPYREKTDIVKSGWGEGSLAICCSCTFPRRDNQ